MPRRSARIAKIKKVVKRLKGRGAYYPGGRVLRGKGGFFDDVGNALKGIAGPALGLIGGALDTVIPGAGSVASGIRRLVGLGAYTPVSSNAILAQPVPKVGSEADNGIRYHHEEYLGDVTSSTDWELTQFHVNPGLPETFPWLSTIASSFQKYRIDGLVFYLRSTSSVAIANSTDLGLGTVLGAMQYNVYDSPPQSKVEMMALSGSLSGKPSEDHIYPLECAPSKGVMTNRLVRHTGVADDLAKYDHAIFNLATVGFPGEYALGELWVSYNIVLMAPKVEDALPFLHNDTNSPDTAVCQVADNNLIHWVPNTLAPSNTLINTLGWKIVTFSDGQPALSIPSGTSGYYQLTFEFDSATHMASGNAYVNPYTLDATGTIAATNKPLIALATSDVVVWSGVYHISTLPDRDGLFRFEIRGANGLSGLTVSVNTLMSIVRCSDRWIPDTTTGAGVVAARVKVVRSRNSAYPNRLTAQRSAAVASVPTLNRVASTLDIPSLANSSVAQASLMNASNTIAKA